MATLSSSTGLSQSDLRALDATRRRLQQLSGTLSSLRQDVAYAETLPSWPTLLETTSVLTHQLSALSTQLQTSSPVFRTLRAYPRPDFPSTAHEPVINQLLRKKNEPGVVSWMEAGRDAGERQVSARESGAEPGLSQTELRELWSRALPAAVRRAERTPFGSDYTAGEREVLRAGGTVETGLKRTLEIGGEEDEEENDEESEEDEEDEKDDGGDGGDGGEDGDPAGETRTGDEDSKMEDADMVPGRIAPTLPVEEILRFMTRGEVSPQWAELVRSGGEQ